LRLPVENTDEIGQLAKAFNEMGQRIEAEATENRALSGIPAPPERPAQQLLKRLTTIQEDERKRVARELHDGLGQALSGLALRAEALKRLVVSDQNRALEQLTQIQALINDTLEQMYELILALRPSVLDDLGLVVALRSHAERLLAGTGIDFELDASEMNGRLPLEVETTLYRIFQEALTNVVRHSGARQVRITLIQRDGTFEGTVADNGRGFDPMADRSDRESRHGLGLSGMQERVTQCCGRLEISSQPGCGTLIHIWIPIGECQ
jgi:signal transduction histidine kinase